MTEAALTIPFAAAAGSTATPERRFVHLEQIKHDQSRETVTMYDLQQMVARARSGMSARTYKPPACPAYIEGNSLVSWFDFYSWPSHLTLPHTIKASLGEVSPPKIVEKPVEFSTTFELSDTVEFDFMLTQITSFAWETPCYDSLGRVVDDVDLSMDGLTTLRASSPIFGVVRIKGKKKGGQHELNVRLVKMVPVRPDGELPTEEEWEESGANEFYTYQEWLDQYYGFTDAVTWDGDDSVPKEPVNMTGLSITNLQATVTALWWDGGKTEETESLRMEIPQCLQDLLRACGIDTDGDGIPDYWGPGTGQQIFDMCDQGEESPWNVYVSGCTGKELLAVKQNDDDNSWCGKND